MMCHINFFVSFHNLLLNQYNYFNFVLKQNEDDQNDGKPKEVYQDDLAIIGKGHAKSALAKYVNF